jgi:hypothetical protein
LIFEIYVGWALPTISGFRWAMPTLQIRKFFQKSNRIPISMFKLTYFQFVLRVMGHWGGSALGGFPNRHWASEETRRTRKNIFDYGLLYGRVHQITSMMNEDIDQPAPTDSF